MDLKSPYIQPEYDRLSQEEIDSLKIFSEHPAMIVLLRKLFYQMTLSDDEKSWIKNLPQSAKNAIEKIFLPGLEWEAPVMMQAFTWGKKEFADYVKLTLATEAKTAILAKQSSIKFIRAGVEYMKTLAPTRILLDIKVEKDYSEEKPEIVKESVLAVQMALEMLESGLLVLQGYANRPAETAEQKKNKVSKDSNK